MAENGKIRLLREALNTVAVAQALLPGGAADLPAPGKVISSFSSSSSDLGFGTFLLIAPPDRSVG